MCVGVSVCLLGVFVSQLALTSELHVDRHHLSRSMCMENISVAMRRFDIIIVHFNPNANTCACGLAVFFPNVSLPKVFRSASIKCEFRSTNTYTLTASINQRSILHKYPNYCGRMRISSMRRYGRAYCMNNANHYLIRSAIRAR